MKPGEEVRIEATLKPTEAATPNANIKWISDDEDVIRTGGTNDNRICNLYAVNPGTTIVWVNAGGYTKRITVNVPRPKTTGIAFSIDSTDWDANANKLTIAQGTSGTSISVTATLSPVASDTSDTLVTWLSSDGNVVSVSDDARGTTKGEHIANLTVKGAGTATITVTVTCGTTTDITKTFTVEITSTRNQSGININKTKPIPR